MATFTPDAALNFMFMSVLLCAAKNAAVNKQWEERHLGCRLDSVLLDQTVALEPAWKEVLFTEIEAGGFRGILEIFSGNIKYETRSSKALGSHGEIEPNATPKFK